MNSFSLKVDPREAQYARLAFAVLRTLRQSVSKRTKEDLSQSKIAKRIDMDGSSLSRILNGRVSNLTLRTISDVLWATEFEPIEFDADAREDLSRNYVPEHLCEVIRPRVATARVYVPTIEAAIGRPASMPSRTLEVVR